jgi:hypothetical protein
LRLGESTRVPATGAMGSQEAEVIEAAAGVLAAPRALLYLAAFWWLCPRSSTWRSPSAKTHERPQWQQYGGGGGGGAEQLRLWRQWAYRDGGRPNKHHARTTPQQQAAAATIVTGVACVTACFSVFLAYGAVAMLLKEPWPALSSASASLPPAVELQSSMCSA